MACDSYSNNGSANVVFSMSTLPGGFCPSGYQALFDAVAQYLVGTLPGNYSTFLISDTTPAAADRDKLWVQVDTNCKPVGFSLYNTANGAWLPVGQKVFDGGVAGGTANALIATADPVVKYLADGCLFIVKAASANTGAATLNVSSTGVYAIKKQGNQALTGGEILPNMVLLLNYRVTGTYFELLNPAPAAAALAPEFRVINGSFETDSDGDGYPDGWGFTAIGAGSGAVNTSVVGHGGKSFKFTVTGTGGGSLAHSTLMPCNEGEVLAVSFWNYTSDPATTDLVTVEWFDSAQASLGAATSIWSGILPTAATRTVNTWQRMFAGMSAPASARFFKLRLVGGSTGAATGSVYFDGVMVDTVVFKRKCSYLYAGAATTISYNFVPPTGVTMVRATVIGGGGTGGVDGVWGAGGGGGAGGTTVAVTPVTPGTSYTVVVGAGGAGGVATVNNGNNSSFNGIIGNGGTSASAAAITAGTGGGGTVPAGSYGWVFNGGDGINGNAGGTPAGAGGNGSGGGGFPGTGAAGGVGSQYGGGGGGTDGVFATGSGGAGAVFIEF